MFRDYTLDSPNLDFAEARRRALLALIRDTLRRQQRELLPYSAVASRFLIRGQIARGIRLVPLAQIIGSQGRYEDFDRSFLPRNERTAERWKRLSAARSNNVDLPPVELYKLGAIYFVADGNHRVSLARYLGQPDIQAQVTEVIIDVPLNVDLELADLVGKEEQGDFFEWTDLARLRPGCAIEVTELGGYLELIRHINWQRACLSVLRDHDVSGEDAVLDWYDTVYLPLVSTIRSSGLLAAFPDRTETDLYLWVMERGQELLQHPPARSRMPKPLAALVQQVDSLSKRLLNRFRS